MSQPHPQPTGDSASSVPPFTPVPVRPRHDGWTPGRQVLFIHALAETANVDEACRRTGMSQQSAYALRARPDAVSFRQAWVIAIEHGVGKLADRALARAMEGVAVPIFYKGEKVGERRVFNERLTMFLLRAHDPERFGAWRDRVQQTRPDPDGAAGLFKEAIRRVAADAVADEKGVPRPRHEPLFRIKVGGDGTGEEDAGYNAMVSHFQHAYEEQEREIERLRDRP